MDDAGFWRKRGKDCSSYEPGLYTWQEISQMILVDGWIPVASAAEFDKIRTGASETMGAGTCWEGTYITGGDKKYVQVLDIDFSGFGTWGTADKLVISDGYIFDGNELWMTNIEQNDCFYSNISGNQYFEMINMRFHGVINHGLGILYNNAVGNNSIVKNLTITCAITSSTTTGVVISGNNTSVFFEDILFTGSVVNSFSSNPDVVNSLIGRITDGIIKNCLLDTSASFDVYSRLSGVVYVLTNSTMENCVNKAQMTATNQGQAANNCYISGVFNTATDSLIKNCKNYADIVNISGFTWVSAFGISISGTTVVEDCENHGDCVAYGCIRVDGIGTEIRDFKNYGNIGIAALGPTVNGTVDGFINYGLVDTTRNGAGVIVTLNGTAKNLINYGKFISKNDGTGPANQNGAGLVNTIGIDGVLEKSIMAGECDMYRQCAGLVRLNNGICRELYLSGNMTVGTNASCAIYTNHGVAENIKIGEIEVVGNASGVIHITGSGSEVTNCISLAELTHANAVGGIRTVQSGASVNDVYFDNTISPISAGQGGTGYSTTDLQTPTSNTGIYSAWSLAVWDFGTSSEYPKLINTP